MRGRQTHLQLAAQEPGAEGRRDLDAALHNCHRPPLPVLLIGHRIVV